MRSKLTVIFSVLMLVSSMLFALPASAKMASADVSEQAGLLQKIGIIDSIADENEGNKEITRAEFIMSAAKMICLSENTSGIRYFIDVPTDHWAIGYINAMVEMGIISQSNDRLFRPNDYITANEALKILVSMCGYGNYAEAAGGYPVGYAQVADKLEIDIPGSNKALTVYESYVMIYDALNAKIYEISGISSGSLVWSQSEETVLSSYFDVYKTSGLVNQARGMSLYTNKAEGSSQEDTLNIVQIDEVKYTSDENMYEYLGRYTTVFYTQTDDDEVPNIIHRISYKNKDNVIEIDADDVDKYENNMIYYYLEDNGKIKNIKLSQGVIILKNGKLENGNTEEAIEINKGRLRVIDNDNDNIADCVIISEYQDFVIDYADESSYEIYNKIISGNKLNLDKDEKIVLIEDANGVSKTFEDLKKGTVLTVYDSEEMIRVIINGNGVTAKVWSTQFVDDKFMLELGKAESDRTWYEIDKDYYNAHFADKGDGVIKITAGTEIVYYLDSHGNIAYIEEPMADGWEFAYLIKTYYDKNEDKIFIKLLNSKGNILRPTVAQKTKIDNIRITSYEMLYANLNKVSNYGRDISLFNEHEVNGQVIRIKTNDAGEIIEIDTEKTRPGEDRMSLKRSGDTTGPVTGLESWYHSNSFTRGQFCFDSSTVRFKVPDHAEQPTASDEDYGVRTSSYPDGKYTLEAFKLDQESGNESVIVDYKAEEETGNGPYLVTKIFEGVNSEDEVVKYAHVYSMNGGVELDLEAKNIDGFKTNDKLKELDKGDLFTAYLDSYGKVTYVNILCDYSEGVGADSASLGIKYGSASQSDRYYYMHAAVKNINQNVMRLVYDMAGENYPYLYDTDTPTRCDWPIRFGVGTLLIYDGKDVTKGDIATDVRAVDIAPDETYWFMYRNATVVAGVVYRPEN